MLFQIHEQNSLEVDGVSDLIIWWDKNVLIILSPWIFLEINLSAWRVVIQTHAIKFFLLQKVVDLIIYLRK